MSVSPNNLPKFLQYRALAFRFQESDKFMDHVLDNTPEGSDVEGSRIVNICFKNTEAFSANIKAYADRLGISRREFMQRAIVHAMELTDQALDEAMEDWPETEADIPTERT